MVLTVTLSSVRVAASHEVQIRDHNGQTGPEPLHNFTDCKIGHSLPEGARNVAVASPGRAYSLLEIMGSAPLPWPWLSQVCCTFQDKILIYVKCLSKLQTSGTCRELACALPCPPMYLASGWVSCTPYPPSAPAILKAEWSQGQARGEGWLCHCFLCSFC